MTLWKKLVKRYCVGLSNKTRWEVGKGGFNKGGRQIIIISNIMCRIGEGNGNPLQYSCLEDPVDRGASHSLTWLKRLSMHACLGEGNGNPLQYSRLKNPRGGGAWWAAIYGVTKSRTRLKRLSIRSRSSSICRILWIDIFFKYVNDSMELIISDFESFSDIHYSLELNVITAHT